MVIQNRTMINMLCKLIDNSTSFYTLNHNLCINTYNKYFRDKSNSAKTWMQKHYAANKEYIKNRNTEYRAAHPDLYNTYYQNNIEEQREYKRIYYRMYREKYKCKQAEYNKTYYKKYYQENKEVYKIRGQKYSSKNYISVRT